jgi:NAD(P)-dependent dehydrogenase (short-subunit alcohol dehydrogenase family)
VELTQGQVAVVTGAACGIGLAMARRFAADGLRVVLADVEESALDKAVAALREQGTTIRHPPQPCDQGRLHCGLVGHELRLPQRQTSELVKTGCGQR